MVSITFYGGVGEIGGNAVLVEGKDTRVLLDFGLCYRKYGMFFEEYLKPRVANGFCDLLELELIPMIEGAYRGDLLALAGKKAHEEPAVDAVLLSHVHYDHSSFISFLDERIPVYCSNITKTIAKSLMESGKRDLLAEIYNFKRRPILTMRDKPVFRDFKTEEISKGEKFKIGEFEITPFSVDHSVPGANAFLIETGGGNVFYTGDFRLHGRDAELTKKCIENAACEDIELLITEGTRVHQEERQSEEDVKLNSKQEISRAKNLAVADFAFKDTSRFKTFYEVAGELGRELAIPLKHAYLYRELRKAGLELPDIKSENILLYKEKKRSGTYREEDYESWEKDFLDFENCIDANFVQRNQNKIIICLGFYEVNELIDLKPSEGSVYIHSASEAHNEEQVIDQKRLDNWLDFFKLKKHHFHASGHASAGDIKELISALKPKKVIPIHTNHPDEFKKYHGNVKIVKEKETVEL